MHTISSQFLTQTLPCVRAHQVHLHAASIPMQNAAVPQVRACAAYASLSKGQTDLVAAEACRLVAELQRLMREVAV